MKIQNNYTINREIEKKSMIDMLGYLLCVIIFVTGVIFYIYPQMAIVDMAYELELKKAEENRLIKKNRFLKVELASLKRLDRIERIAGDKLGLIPPDDEQVVYIKN